MGTGASDMNDVQRQAGQVADEAQDKVGQAVDQAKQQASEVADKAAQQADQALGAVQQQASALVNEQITRASSAFGGVAQALRATGEELRNQEQGNFARYADRAAEQLDSISTHLQNGDVGTLLRDVESFARREPAIFMSGALAAGLLLARFLKSSNEQPGRQRYAGRNRYPIEEYQGGYARGGSQWDSPSGGDRSYGAYGRDAQSGRYGARSGGMAGGAAGSSYSGSSGGMASGAADSSYGGSSGGMASGAAGSSYGGSSGGGSRYGGQSGASYGAMGSAGGSTEAGTSSSSRAGASDQESGSTGWQSDEGV